MFGTVGSCALKNGNDGKVWEQKMAYKSVGRTAMNGWSAFQSVGIDGWMCWQLRTEASCGSGHFFSTLLYCKNVFPSRISRQTM